MGKVKVIEVKIPNLGEAQTTEIIEVNIIKGTEVNINDPLIVLESEKAAMEIPSDYEGKVIEVMVKEGDEVSEGQVFAKIESSLDKGDEKYEKNEESPQKLNLSKSISANKSVNKSLESSFNGINAGPAVRKYARELEINLNDLTGTGRNGQITKIDLKNYIHNRFEKSNSYPAKEDFDDYGTYQLQKLSKIRSLGAKNMHKSWTSIPHVTHFEEADLTTINNARKKNNFTPLVFFIKAVAKTLKEFPIFNSSLLANDEVLLKDYVNIGIAVDTDDGLVVPVIKDADTKSISRISEIIIELADKAKNKKLRTSDLEASTFTISSLGKIGGTGFTPIINPPEVGIIALSRSKKQLILLEGKVHEVEVIPFSLSYDHRVINGADAGRFMNSLKQTIENFEI